VDLQRFLFPSRIEHASQWRLTEGAPFMAAENLFNIWDPEFRANSVSALRSAAGRPAAYPHMGPMTFALVARYADVTPRFATMSTYRASGRPPPPQAYQGRFGRLAQLCWVPIRRSTRRLRRLVSRDFTPRRIRELEPRIARSAKDQARTRSRRKARSTRLRPRQRSAGHGNRRRCLGVPPELTRNSALVGHDHWRRQ